MKQSPVGVWLVGARGGVATTVTIGLAALAKGLTNTTGLVSCLPQFGHLDLVDWSSVVLGGHEIRQDTLREAALRLHAQVPQMDRNMLEAIGPELDAVDGRIRRGTLAHCGQTIEALADDAMGELRGERAADTIERLKGDLQAFRQECGAERVIVVHLASTEPPLGVDRLPPTWDELRRLLDTEDGDSLPASSLYAIAALDLGMPYINFTPSLGSAVDAIDDLARQRGACHAGRDGKTGETLLKSVLAPMFAARNLQVMSWVGHNIFGNLDGRVLDDPANKSAKVKSKDRVLGRVLGYDPQTLVTIEYIESLGDWKTAWDHIHFQGFLGTPMTLQFTWQGSDSLLAGPLVLDLIRFVELAGRRGETGVLSFLSSFFKDPQGTSEYAFSRQFEALLAWAEQARG